MNIQNAYFFLAVAGSVIFLVQFVITLTGMGGESDLGEVVDGSSTEVEVSDAADASGFNFLSIKTITSFVTFFGWGGVFWGDRGLAGLFIAIGCGLAMMFITAFILSMLLKLQQSGNITGKDFIGQHGVVYVSVPAGRTGQGRITVEFPGCTREVQALADEELRQGEPVEVVEALGPELFLVKKA